ncbi:Not1 N-terminal domain, CCR4-Not complex component-domain-containing protein [Mycena pura]|uniref:General negative regulator of transcription subunit n=1 Tax=Mycena pura TaxID=153505 RepID=A0AAD6VEM7_9AGAR|nr:Not1 N-terminal domain, CCR4-Not complex component-domain-containing protein [Mycena pura]
MAARKLQTEIDQALKKVGEGVELFETTYDKMQATTNQAQKEKLEAALKNQIKKLQRLRDQIRAWVASNDIKDKTVLLDNRRLIETQMEKFKACEKEVKKKAFSNVALGEAIKLDPKEQEMIETVEWLDSQLDKLQIQVEQAEAEIETLQGTAKKKSKSGTAASGRLEDLDHLNSRRKWHISRLEIVLRMLNNGTLDTERVLALKEDVHYFVETNMEEDFTEYEGIYDELNLDEEEERFRGALEDNHDSDEESEALDESSSRALTKKASEDTSKRADSPILKKTPAPLLRTKPPANFNVQSMSSLLKPAAPRAPPTLPPRGYSAAVQQQPPQPPVPPPTKTPNLAPLLPPSTPAMPATPPWSSAVEVPSSPSMTHPSAASPMSSYASISHERESSFYESPALSEAVPAPSVASGPIATSSPPQRVLASPKDSVASPPRAPSPPTSITRPIPEPMEPQTSQPQSREDAEVQEAAAPQFPPGVKIDSEQPQAAPTTIGASAPSQPIASASSQAIGGHRQPNGHGHPPSAPLPPSSFPPGLADLVLPFERAKQRGESPPFPGSSQRMADMDTLNKYLETGLSSIPQPQDTLKAKYYTPRNPHQTPSYYPQAPLSLLNNKALYSQIDVETLFYIFYFVPVSYPKYLAAEELKRQSWRFHVKYLTWFQRHSEPQAITEEYEQGVYVYFDWEGSWCQRKKSDFRFEYRYLAED